jgi:hypothetical protein
MRLQDAGPQVLPGEFRTSKETNSIARINWEDGAIIDDPWNIAPYSN